MGQLTWHWLGLLEDELNRLGCQTTRVVDGQKLTEWESSGAQEIFCLREGGLRRLSAVCCVCLRVECLLRAFACPLCVLPRPSGGYCCVEAPPR